MKKAITIVGILLFVGWSSLVMAADHMSHGDGKKMTGSGMEKMTGMTGDAHEAMGEHKDGEMGDMASGKTFMHHAVVDGMRADIKVMSLASMNMTDPKGATHHIMLELRKDGTDARVEDVVGKVKVIGPDKAEQSGSLKNYSGIYAANMSFKESGRYGIICLVKVGDQKYLYKFWYPHG
jgi:hypothetical protein